MENDDPDGMSSTEEIKLENDDSMNIEETATTSKITIKSEEESDGDNGDEGEVVLIKEEFNDSDDEIHSIKEETYDSDNEQFPFKDASDDENQSVKDEIDGSDDEQFPFKDASDENQSVKDEIDGSDDEQFLFKDESDEDSIDDFMDESGTSSVINPLKEFFETKQPKLENESETMNTKPEVVIHKCPYCDHSTKSIDEFKNHRDTEHYYATPEEPNRKKYHCNICHRVFLQNSTLLNHVKLHGIELKCQNCDYQPKNPKDLDAHTKMKHLSMEKFECFICGAIIFWKHSFVRHLKAHPNAQCTKCDYISKDNLDLYMHYEMHKTTSDSKPEVTTSGSKPEITSGSKSEVHLKLDVTRVERPIHRCVFCEYLPENFLDYMAHRKKEHFYALPGEPDGKKKFHCNMCPKVCAKTKELLFHVREHGIKLSCQYCDYQPKSISDLSWHQKHEHMKAPLYTCCICDKVALRNYNLYKHLKRHEFSGKCLFCTYKPKNNEELQTHYADKHYDPALQKFYCIFCTDFFLKKADLIKHVEIHKPFEDCKIVSPEKPGFSCTICPYSCNDITKLKRHQNKHVCTICGFKPTNRSEVLKHRADKHGELKLFCCEICGKRYFYQHYLATHKISAHSNIKKFECEKCLKKFNTRTNLNGHLQTHKDEKYECEICKKCFKSPGYLAKHAKIHTEKYFCNICGKTFGLLRSFKGHLLTHETTKKFQCSQCENTFNNKDNLRYHMKAWHKGMKYQCEFCEKGFSKEAALKVHEKLHKSEKLNKCKFCEKRFTFVKSLKEHLKTHEEPIKE